MLNAVLYLRVSLDATGEGLAVERQRQDCERIAHARGWRIVETYTDNSVSAYDRRKRRPAYDRMVQDYAAGRFQALICWDLDRLTRQPRQLEDWIDAAEERGLVLVTANGEADLGTDAGRLFARIKAAVARGEVERKGVRQRRAMAQRVERGKIPAGVRLTGYAQDGTVIPDEAATVRRIFELFTAGESLYSIARTLTDDGTPTRRGDRWHQSSVREILTNPRYAGRQVFEGRATGHLGTWDAIVPAPLFDTVQAILTDPRRITNHEGTERRHLGAGLYLCGVCDRPVKSHGPRYGCWDGHLWRSRRLVDEAIQGLVVAWLDDADLSTVPTPDEVPDDLAALRARLVQVERDYDEDLIDGRRYAVKRAKIEAELAAAERAHRASRGGVALAGLIAVESPSAAFLAAPVGIRREIVRSIMEVRLHRQAQGRRGLDPESIGVTWRLTA